MLKTLIDIGKGRNYDSVPQQEPELTDSEIIALRQLLREKEDDEFEEFAETTHAWAVFGDNLRMERFVGAMIITFQLFTYYLFAREAIASYEEGVVAVEIAHSECRENHQRVLPSKDDLVCEAEVSSNRDALVAYFMLAVFLASDLKQAYRAVWETKSRTSLVFAMYALLEVVAAYFAACVSVSQQLYVGQVTDAVEVGVGLLFIRDLSDKAYHAICYKSDKNYASFFGVLVCCVVVGMYVMDPLCEHLFAK